MLARNSLFAILAPSASSFNVSSCWDCFSRWAIISHRAVRHLIEGDGQLPDFILGFDHGLNLQVAARYPFRGAHQPPHRPDDNLSEYSRHPDS